MTAAALLVRLTAAGIRLEVVGDRIRYDAPAGAFTDDLRAQLAQVRDELIRILEGTRPASLPGERCGAPSELAMERGADGERPLAGVPAATKPAACAACGRIRPLMLAMEPGADGQPWALCSGCWA